MLTEASRRRDFPSLEEMTYLNTAAEGIPPLSVGDALQQYFHDKQMGSPGRVPHAEWWDATRELTAEFYGLTVDQIGICSCTSEAYNLAALALNLREGDEVVINDLDFPAGRTAWLQPSCPATVRVWRSREGALRIEDLIPLLNGKTRLVSTSLVSFLNGFMIPLRAVVEAVHAHCPGLLAVDVTQALGRVPLDLRGVDLIVSSTHKWICATHGGGLVGVPEGRRETWTCPAGGWFHLQDVFGQDVGDQVRSRPGAESFMVGMPNYAAVYAVKAGLEYIKSVGVEAIDRQVRPLVHHCLSELAKLPVQIITPREDEALAGILSFRPERMAEIHAALAEQKIHVMGNAGRMRVAIHGYNTPEDVERFLAALKALL